jgi:type VI protein secretion system component Hcp
MITNRFLRKVTVFSFLSLALLTGSVRAASGLSLYIPGVPGDGTTNLIEVFAFSFGVLGSPPPAKPFFQDLNVTKQLDSASAPLMFQCASATVLNNVVLTYTDNNGKPAYTIKVDNVTISSYQVGGSSGGGTPTESISLHFQNIQWTYQKYDASGNPVGSPITHTWDVVAGTGT